ncbi:MAG: carbamoyltransferase HypF, partial [Saezia sp.]
MTRSIMHSNGILIRINGKVQGVGFRPYVWQLANALGLRGDVANNGEGVMIHLWQGDEDASKEKIAAFLEQLPKSCPPLACILSIESAPYTWGAEPANFQIIHSSRGEIKTHIIPDAATCPACLAEMNDTADRRYRYPFINCTHCGPRFSIVERIPYDRANTSMRVFPMCLACQAEYENPADRRFHAQPNACPECGPHAFLCGGEGKVIAQHHEAIEQAAQAIMQEKVVAVKGIGGFHLVCDATNSEAVAILRQRKDRPSKPLAVMLPDEVWLQRCACSSEFDALAQLLKSAAAPIALMRQNADSALSPLIAPQLNEVGVMLPANPLQHLLLQQVKRPLVMTSGNARGKPPALSNSQALEELRGIADVWLMHNRDIVQRVDDSVVRFDDENAAVVVEVLRRARGYVPDALQLPEGFKDNTPILAMGADLKNTFCILRPNDAVMSQHFGDLEDLQIQQQVEQGIALFENIYQLRPQAIAIDAHSGYVSHQLGKRMAAELQVPVVEVLHHHAHIVACMAEHGLAKDHPPIIGLALDGLGLGENGQLWGGECLLVNYTECTHLGGLPAVALPGGNLASRQPWRNLLAHLHQFAPDWQALTEASHIPQANKVTLIQAIERGLNSPTASSTGRLFDAVAAALGIAPLTLSWEGEAACQLEALAQSSNLNTNGACAFPVTMPVIEAEKMTLDLARFWQQWLRWQAPAADRAYAFHYALAQGFAQMARLAAQNHGVNTIVLSGGVLHNALLRQLLLNALKGYQVLMPNMLPAGDGSVAL